MKKIPMKTVKFMIFFSYSNQWIAGFFYVFRVCLILEVTYRQPIGVHLLEIIQSLSVIFHKENKNRY